MTETPTRTPRELALRILAAIAAVIVVVVGVVQLRSASVLARGPWQASVAVMPFENRTGDPTFDNLGRSLAEDIINRLTTVAEIRVIDPYTAASLMSDSLGTPALLDTLNVDHVIHGYIESRGGDLIVNVSESDREGFLSLRTQHRLDPARLDVQQVALAGTVTRSFLTDVGLEDRFDPGGSVIGPGRDAYLAGNAALGRRTAAGLGEAIDDFHTAIALEPGSAAALAALSSAYALALYYKYDVGVPAYELAARSLAAADSAIALDPTVANGFSARGYIRALIGLDIDGADADFARAEELAPNAPNGPSWSARILAGQGQVDRAYREAERARDLDPLQAGRRTALASLGFQLGDYEVTIEEAREAYRLEPSLSLARAYEARALALTGQGQECLRMELGVYDSVHSLCLFALGRVDEASALVEATARQIESGTPDGSEYMADLLAQDLASFYGFAGDADAALRWIEIAFDLSPSGVDERLLGSALFDPVRGASGFASRLDRIRDGARARVRETRGRLQPPL